MNKITCAIGLLCLALAAHAQPKTTYDYGHLYPGYIITQKNDTMRGFIEYGQKETNQGKCIFYTDDQDRKTKKVYKPSELNGYTMEDLHYKSVGYSGNIGFLKSSERNFLLITTPGHINSYSFYLDGEQLVWQKGDEAPVSNSSMFMGFKKNILKLVGDYPELVAKIEAKEKGYGMLGITGILKEYNDWYATKK